MLKRLLIRLGLRKPDHVVTVTIHVDGVEIARGHLKAAEAQLVRVGQRATATLEPPRETRP